MSFNELQRNKLFERYLNFERDYFSPNLTKVSQAMGISRTSLYKFINYDENKGCIVHFEVLAKIEKFLTDLGY